MIEAETPHSMFHKLKHTDQLPKHYSPSHQVNPLQPISASASASSLETAFSHSCTKQSGPVVVVPIVFRQIESHLEKKVFI